MNPVVANEFEEGQPVDTYSKRGIPLGKVVVVETVYHQPPGEQPTAVESGFFKVVDGETQVYGRRMKVGEEWQPIAPGCWLSKISMMVVENKGTKFTETLPTLEERKQTTAKIIELGFFSTIELPPDGSSRGNIVIHPGESNRFQPIDPNSVFIRCLSGTTNYVVTLFPG